MSEKVSIIVPFYNAEEYLSKCVSSLIDQNHSNLQIILIDDGSTDESAVLAREYEKKDGRIKLIIQKNGGVSEARNEGLKAAEGDYVAFVDADDWLDKEAISCAIETACQTNADVVMWAYTREYKDRAEIKHIFDHDMVFEHGAVKSKLQRRIIGLVGNELRHPDRADGLSPVWGKLYKATLLKDLSFPDIREIGTYEDGLFNFRVFDRVNKAVYLDQFWYHYRKGNQGSATAFKQQTAKQWETMLDVMERELERGDYCDEYLQAFQNRICTSILSKSIIMARSTMSLKEQIQELKRQLHIDRTRNAFQQFQLSEMPFHWKFFYFCCQRQYSLLVVLMANCMNFLVKRVG